MTEIFYDETAIQYAFSVLINLYGAVLFSWWWIKNKSASFMFICVTLLFVGGFIEKGFLLYARILRVLYGFLESSEFAGTPFWAYKSTLGTIIAFFVVVYMTGRVFGYFQVKNPKRRIGDI